MEAHAMIRDSAPNRSLVLLKFREVIQATEFAEVYNGKSFNSMEVSRIATFYFLCNIWDTG